MCLCDAVDSTVGEDAIIISLYHPEKKNRCVLIPYKAQSYGKNK